MTTEQLQELAVQTDRASQANDLSALVDIYRILQQDRDAMIEENDPMAEVVDFEWFASSLTSDQWNHVLDQTEKS